MGIRKRVTKAEALAMFREAMQGVDLSGDTTAKREAWNDYTDGLCKDGLISDHQYNTWSNPY